MSPKFRTALCCLSTCALLGAAMATGNPLLPEPQWETGPAPAPPAPRPCPIPELEALVVRRGEDGSGSPVWWLRDGRRVEREHRTGTAVLVWPAAPQPAPR